MFEQVFSRISLPAARAFVAGTAILAGAVIPLGPAGAQDPSDDTALAIPRLTPPGSDDSVALPQPLPAGEARLLREAFNNRSMPTEALAGNPLLGTVLADRYLSDPRRPSTPALRAWLNAYPDYPDAPAIHALLASRLPKGEAPPPPPLLPVFTPAPYGDDIEAQPTLLPRNPALDRSVHSAASNGDFDAAIRIIARTSTTPEYGALLRAEVARAMFSHGDNRGALRIARAANEQAHGKVGLAAWVGGLSAWRLGRIDLARTLFAEAYHAELIVPGQRAGAAYWAARASLAVRGDAARWMRRAAQHPRTFYGLLARRVLGQPIPTEDEPDETLGEADVEATQAQPRGVRAFALLQAGQPQRAAAELRLLWSETRDRPGYSRSILLVARAAGLPGLAGQLGAVMQPARVRLPPHRLRPAGGFKVSPALVYALTRLESNFDAEAVSPFGATGLMQLMPATARYVLAGAAKPRLHDPAANLALGQQYLLRLDQLGVVGSDLIRLLAAYNAGPGTMARWLGTIGHETDPLLFIEALPGDETRAYVPRALAYSWLYAAQLGLPSPSLDELAAGLWPHLQASTPKQEAVVRLH